MFTLAPALDAVLHLRPELVGVILVLPYRKSLLIFFALGLELATVPCRGGSWRNRSYLTENNVSPWIFRKDFVRD